MLKHRRPLFAILPVIVALLAARPAISRAQTAPQTPPDGIVMTSADNGGTLYIGVGQTLFIHLDPNNVWTPTSEDDTILQAVPDDTALPDGDQGAFTALAPGTTAIRAAGRAHCSAGQACPQFVILFTTTITVLPQGVVVLGPAANNGTVAIAQGDTVIVQQGAGFDWTFSYDPPASLAEVDYFPTLPTGIQTAVQPQESGEITLSATGTPHCAPNQACIALAAIWSTMLEVQ